MGTKMPAGQTLGPGPAPRGRAPNRLRRRPFAMRRRSEKVAKKLKVAKLRKGGGKALKSLARVTLCAGLRSRAGRVGSPTKSCLAEARRSAKIEIADLLAQGVAV